MATRNRSWIAKLFGSPKQPFAARKPYRPKPRFLRVEFLEPRTLLSGSSLTDTLNAYLASVTPDPQPSGDQPANLSQEVPLANYSPSPLPPDPGISPTITQFIAELAQVQAEIADNPAARPVFWAANVTGAANQVCLHLDDNGMLIDRWTIDWGDGSSPQTVSPQPSVIHQYAAAGQYTIGVTASSPDGSYSAAATGWYANLVGIGGGGSTLQVSLPAMPPTLHVAGPQTVAQGQTFALDDLASFSYGNASNSTGFTYTIDWGDGTPPFSGSNVDVIAPGNGVSPFLGALASDAGDGPLTHVYASAGTYYLAVTVTADDSGLSDTQTIPINAVTLAPTITGLPSTCDEGTTVNLGAAVDTTLTDPVAYNWQITDSSGDTLEQSTDPNPSYTFADPDTYTVTLAVSVDNVTSAPVASTITVNSVAPVITSPTITGSASVGQTCTLSGVSFTDAGINDTHTALIDWGDGSTPDDAQVNEPYLDTDGVTDIPGTISDTHVFAAAGTYIGTITLTDESGNSVTQNFTVSVAAAAVSLNTFTASSDGSQLQVSYTVSSGTAAPFNIDVYTSPDGSTPDQLLMSDAVTVNGTNFPLTTGTYTASFTPTFDDIASDFHLIAVADANSDSTQNTVEFAGGVFVAASLATPTQNIVYVFGTSGAETVSVTNSSVQLTDSAATTLLPLAGISDLGGIHVRGEYGNEVLHVDADVTAPLWLYGGSTTDLLDGGSGQNVVNGDIAWNTPQIVDDAAGDATGSSYTYDEIVPSGDPGWSPAGQGFNGTTERGHVPESSGTAGAEWTFANLDPSGYYDVYVSWSPNGGTSTAAQYSVYDGTTQLGGALPAANQTQAPADAQEAGAFWHELGVFQVATSGSLAVGLSAESTDTTGEILADAAMIVPLGTAPVTNLVMDANGFTVDQSGNLSVTYTINGEDSPPFSIGIYGSPDGRQAGLLPSPSGGGAGGEGGLLQTYDITDPTLLGGGGQTYTVSIPPDLNGDSSPYLVAMLDCYDQVTETTKADNVSSPLSGVFQNGDGAVYVMGSDSVNETVTFSQNPSSGTTTVTINGAARDFTNASSLYVTTGGGSNTIDASGVNLPLTAYAGSGVDTIIGSAGSDEIYGGSGTDTIYGGTGDNWIQAGSGSATIYGGPEDDWLYGGSGTDKITGGSGTEVIHGGSGTDTLIGGSGLDDIYGGSGTNFIYGNGVNDILDGGSNGQNFIQPNPNDSLGSIQVKDSNNVLTFDGTIDSNGHSYTGDYQAVDPSDPGYGGLWTFDNFNSGARLARPHRLPWRSTPPGRTRPHCRRASTGAKTRSIRFMI